MRLIEQCEDGERSDEEEAGSSSSWKGFSEVQNDCNIEEERLDEANEIHWEEYNSAVDESTSTDEESTNNDEECYDHENEVYEEEDTQQNLTYLLELKEVEV